jgi:hypothetical protein
VRLRLENYLFLTLSHEKAAQSLRGPQGSAPEAGFLTPCGVLLFWALEAVLLSWLPGSHMLRDSKPKDYGRKMRSKATALFAMFLVVVSLVAVVRLSNAASNTSDYKLVQKVTLGGEGGWDYFDVDSATGDVFIPRGDHILVVDSSGKQVADIGNVHGTHAIVFAPELKRAYLRRQSRGQRRYHPLESLRLLPQNYVLRKEQ